MSNFTKYENPTYLLTYLLTPWSGILLEKLTISQLAKKFPTLYGTRKFFTGFRSIKIEILVKKMKITS
jgi:hypothetical protein